MTTTVATPKESLCSQIEHFADQVRDDERDAAMLLDWAAYLLAPSNNPDIAKGLLLSMAGDLDELAHRIEPGGFTHDDDEEA